MEESYSQKKRQVLEAIADMSRVSRIVLYPTIRDRLGMSDRELAAICNGLDEQGLINFPEGDFVEMRDAGDEALEAPKPASPATINYMHIHQNYGPVAQGANFIQNVTDKTEFDESIEKLLKAVEESHMLFNVQR